jgi:hypothetical protein
MTSRPNLDAVGASAPRENFMTEKSVQVNDSKERVALELMRLIMVNENDTKDRAYYLKLMSECISVVNGNEPN